MAASALNEERELAIHPIVGTSVQHNTQVRQAKPPSFPPPLTMTLPSVLLQARLRMQSSRLQSTEQIN